MRTLSLVDSIHFSISGSVIRNALYFGDADNDGLNEFVIGCVDGNLTIYRNNKCIVGANDLGEICAITIGDLLNIERNMLVIACTDGWCHVFDVEKELHLLKSSVNPESADKVPKSPVTMGSTSFATSSGVGSFPTSDTPSHFLPPDTPIITPFHSQRIPPNIKTIHIGDVNSDGLVELIVGLTDRVLRTYQWKAETVEQNISAMTSVGYTRAYYENPIYEGCLVALNKWEFPSQICSSCLYQKNDTEVSILVSHPGGTVTEISEVLKEETASPEQNAAENADAASIAASTKAFFERSLSGQKSSIAASSTTSAVSAGSTSRQRNFSVKEEHRNPILPQAASNSTRIIIKQHDLYPPEEDVGRRNRLITSEIIANVKSMRPSEEGADCYAVCTLDGTVLIAKENVILWKHEVEEQIFALTTINGKLLTCSWSGETVLTDSKQRIKFDFEEPVLTFAAGTYGLAEDSYSKDSKMKNQFCVAYVTFNEKVFIYPVEPTIL